jgi:hypothetical protein
MVKWLLFALAIAGCFEDRYKCMRDAQCDVDGGRCELDNYCTKLDDGCPSGRRYQHAGEHGDDCFDDRLSLSNLCAGGQGPAKPTGCIADVCERLPACCTLGWSDTCVQLAQESCSDLWCDTRIAIVATRGVNVELWDLRWGGYGFDFARRQDLAPPLQWVGPAPGDFFPRLAGTTAVGELVVGELVFPMDPAYTYTQITTVNFDRDRRDTIAVARNIGNATDHTIDFFKPPNLVPRSVAVQASLGLSWGDLDRDRYPDAVTRANQQYQYNPSIASDAGRTLLPQTLVNAGGGPTQPAPGVRSIDWLDFDGDKRLDLVMFGSEVRIHTADEIREAAEHQIDCEPPTEFVAQSRPAPCQGATEPNFEAVAFAGAGLPTLEQPSVIVTTYPHRRIMRFSMEGGVVQPPEPIFDAGCKCGGGCTCNPDCVCNFDCDLCLPFLAVVARDLDGDHALDIVAIDARLNVYHAFAATSFQLVGPTSLPISLANQQGFVQIQTSVSGAPIP